MSSRLRIWLGRSLIGLVFLFNVQCALVFILNPAGYAGAFELSGPVGEGMLRALGILFLMWNVPYALALVHPLKERTSLLEAVAMQTIGFAGESLLLASFPAGHAAIRESILRFIWFDGGGLLALLTAAYLTRPSVMTGSAAKFLSHRS